MDSGFHNQQPGFWITIMVGFRIPLAGFRIPKPWIPDSTDQITWIPDSGFQTTLHGARRVFENTRELQKTRTSGGCFPHKKKRYLCNYISKWLDFQVFSDKESKPEVPSHNPCRKNNCGTLKNPNTIRVGRGVLGVVVWPSRDRSNWLTLLRYPS